MKSAVILGAGDFPRAEYPRYLLSKADVIICCDDAFEGFLRHRDKIFRDKRLPDAIVGDMDSLSPKLRKEYSGIVHHFTEQEHNDQTKAFRFLMEHWHDVDTIHILGATGKREVHTIGNMSLLMEYAREYGACGIPKGSAPYVDMVSDKATIFAITDSCSIQVGEGRPVSIFSPDNSLNIKSVGLEWPLDNVIFDNWWKATLNRASADTVILKFSHPAIALIVLE
jgi:thiamine pyrophosphokinase